MKLVVLYPAIAIHREGCRDATKALRNHYDSKTRSNVELARTVEGVDVSTILQEIVDDLNESFGFESEEQYGEPAPWRLSALTVYPCVTHYQKKG